MGLVIAVLSVKRVAVAVAVAAVVAVMIVELVAVAVRIIVAVYRVVVFVALTFIVYNNYDCCTGKQ